MPEQSALGMIETWGVPALIAAADTAAKTADVRITTYEKADAGLVTVYVWGDVASVKAAVDAGAAAAGRVGKLISAHVIPRPDPELAAMLQGRAKTAEAPAPSTQAQAAAKVDWDTLPVNELRRRARATPGFPLSGRQISAAGKAVLIRLLSGQKE